MARRVRRVSRRHLFKVSSGTEMRRRLDSTAANIFLSYNFVKLTDSLYAGPPVKCKTLTRREEADARHNFWPRLKIYAFSRATADAESDSSLYARRGGSVPPLMVIFRASRGMHNAVRTRNLCRGRERKRP